MEDSIKYIRELQRECSSQLFGRLEDILKFRKHQWNLTDNKINKLVKKFKNRSLLKYQENIYNQYIAKPFLDALPKEVSEKLKDVYIGILPTYKMNASALKSPNGKPIIILHSQLLTAIQQYNETQMIYGRISENNETHAKNFLCKSLIEISKCFVYHNYSPKMSFLPPILDHKEFSIVSGKTFIQELFIIAHEYAHIYLGHLDKIETKNINDNITIDEYVKKQKFELEADVQAVKWIILVSSKKTKIFNVLTHLPYLAIEIFMLFHTLEVNSKRYSNIVPDLHNKLTSEEYGMRQINLFKEIDDLLSRDIIDSNDDHPKAAVRMAYVILCTRDLFDKNEQRLLDKLLHNVVFYETFKFNSLI